MTVLTRLAGIAVAFAAVAYSHAAIIIMTGNSPGDTENVLFDVNQPTGFRQVGTTNQTNSIVNFDGQELLDASGSQGQARLEAVDGGFTELCIDLDDPLLGYTRIILNLNATADGSVTFTASDMFGSDVMGTFALRGSGENFFTVYATNGSLIDSLCFTTTVDLQDVRQVRLGGVQANAIPGPAALLPFAVGLASMRRRRRSR